MSQFHRFVGWVQQRPAAAASWGLIFVIVVIGFYACAATNHEQKLAYCSMNKENKMKAECKGYLDEINRKEKEEQKLAAAAAAQKQQELEGWLNGSGAEYSCEEALKQRLRDPSSYERAGEFVRDTPTDGYGKTLMWKFRAKNGFGGYNVSIGMCKATTDNGGSVEASIIGDN